MDTRAHLIVEAGPDRGKEIIIPSEGARIGRSTRNDVVLNDPAMSRFHCRFFLKAGEGIWVADLGSSNETLVNGKPVQEVRLRPGDEISIGDTTLRVLSDAPQAVGDRPAPAAPLAAPVVPSAPLPAAEALAPAEPAIDLGLRKSQSSGRSLVTPQRKRLMWAAALMALVALIAWLPKDKIAGWAKKQFGSAPPPPVEKPVDLPAVEIAYERVEATASNIFRYSMDIRNHTMVVQVDDVQNARHVRREKKVDPELIRALGKAIESAGFFDLLADYSGMAPGVYETSDISVTLGARTHRAKIVNHVEPEAFGTARGQIEEFGKNELGLAALAIEPDKLVAKAEESLLFGRKLYDEREVRYENLAAAIRAFREAEWYVETIEPKPAFYAEAINRRGDCERELQKRYDDMWFMAERAVKLRDWKEAAKHLRIVCEMIPDRSDERNQNAYKKLVDVERRLGAEK